MASKEICNYFEKKYSLGTVGLIKAAAVVTLLLKNKDVPAVSLLTIAPSGQFKSRLNKELMDMLPASRYEDIGSDFTIHSLIKKFDSGKKCNNKTLLINDLTLLFSSKQPRAKERLVNAFAEVLSEGIYQYGERLEPDLKFECHVNIIANITRESYSQNKKNFLENTFGERLVPIFYELTDTQQTDFIRDVENRKSMSFGAKLKLKPLSIDNFDEFKEDIIRLSQRYKIFTGSPSLPRANDKVRGLLAGLCILDQRSRILKEDIELISERVLPLTINPENKDAAMLDLYLQGKSVAEIKNALGYENSDYPYKVIRKYKLRGVIS